MTARKGYKPSGAPRRRTGSRFRIRIAGDGQFDYIQTMLLNIDTQKVHSALLAGGFTQKQADTVIETMRSIDLTHLATKDDLKVLDAKMDTKFSAFELKMEPRFAAIEQRMAKIEGDVQLLKWMMGFLLAGMLSLVLKAYGI